MVRQVVACLLVMSSLWTPASSAPTRLMLFNQAPAGSYQVRRNGATSGVAVASPSGALIHDAVTAPGDRFEFIQTGLNPVTPARPAGVSAAGSGSGCVTVRWNPPATGDYVSDYSLLWGPGAGAYTDSVQIDGVDIAKGASWIAGHCGLASGTWVFALRAHNAFDRWSPLSAPASVVISNEDTQGPLPPTNVRASETSTGCVSIAWTRSGDATVAGYRVLFGRRPRSQAAYTDSIDAGDATSASHCGLSAGNYYVSVRSYTATGEMSAYSKEAMLAVGATTAPVEARGVIVPDGFWAGDPSRPLEIRKLPRDWCVRIFDTSGHAVRRHVNTVDDETWTWNFRNDVGGRVAPALYLVRVTDAGGTVQRSGRFLVQSRQ